MKRVKFIKDWETSIVRVEVDGQIVIEDTPWDWGPWEIREVLEALGIEFEWGDMG